MPDRHRLHASEILHIALRLTACWWILTVVANCGWFALGWNSLGLERWSDVVELLLVEAVLAMAIWFGTPALARLLTRGIDGAVEGLDAESLAVVLAASVGGFCVISGAAEALGFRSTREEFDTRGTGGLVLMGAGLIVVLHRWHLARAVLGRPRELGALEDSE